MNSSLLSNDELEEKFEDIHSNISNVKDPFDDDDNNSFPSTVVNNNNNDNDNNSFPSTVVNNNVDPVDFNDPNHVEKYLQSNDEIDNIHLLHKISMSSPQSNLSTPSFPNMDTTALAPSPHIQPSNAKIDVYDTNNPSIPSYTDALNLKEEENNVGMKNKCKNFWWSSSRKNRTRRFCFLIFVTLSSFLLIRVTQALSLLESTTAFQQFEIIDTCDNGNTIKFFSIVEVNNPSPIEVTIGATALTEVNTKFGKIGNVITPEISVVGGVQTVELPGSLRICSTCFEALKDSLQFWVDGNNLDFTISVPLEAQFPPSFVIIPVPYSGWLNITNFVTGFGNRTYPDEFDENGDLIEYSESELLNSVELKQTGDDLIGAAIGILINSERSKKYATNTYLEAILPQIYFDAYIDNQLVGYGATQEFDFVPITSDKYTGQDVLMTDVEANWDHVEPLQNVLEKTFNEEDYDIGIQAKLPPLPDGQEEYTDLCIFQRIASGIFINNTVSYSETRRRLLHNIFKKINNNNNNNNNNKNYKNNKHFKIKNQKTKQVLYNSKNDDYLINNKRNLQTEDTAEDDEFGSSFISLYGIDIKSVSNSSMKVDTTIDFEGLVNWRNFEGYLPQVFIDLIVDELSEDGEYKFAELNLNNDGFQVSKDSYFKSGLIWDFEPLNSSQLFTTAEQAFTKESPITLNVGLRKNTGNIFNEVFSAVGFSFEIVTESDLNAFEQEEEQLIKLEDAPTSQIILNVTSDELSATVDLKWDDVGSYQLNDLHLSWDFAFNLEFSTQLINENDYFQIATLNVEPYSTSDPNPSLNLNIKVNNKVSNIDYVFDLSRDYTDGIPFNFSITGEVDENKINLPDIEIKRIITEKDEIFGSIDLDETSFFDVDLKYATLGGVTDGSVLNFFGGLKLLVDGFEEDSNTKLKFALPLLPLGLASSGECTKVKNGFTKQPPQPNMASFVINPIVVEDVATSIAEGQIGIEIIDADRIMEVGSLLLQDVEQEICLTAHPTVTSSYLGKLLASLIPSFVFSSQEGLNNDLSNENNTLTIAEFTSDEQTFCASVSLSVFDFNSNSLIGWDTLDLTFKTLSSDLGFFNIQVDHGYVGSLTVDENDVELLALPSFYNGYEADISLNITSCFYTEDISGGESAIEESAGVAKSFFENILGGDSESYRFTGTIGSGWSSVFNDNPTTSFDNQVTMPGSILDKFGSTDFFDDYGKTLVPSAAPLPSSLTVPPTVLQTEAPTFIIPDGWVCPDDWWDDSICDCNCGVQDPKCDTQPLPAIGCTGIQVCVEGECKDPPTQSPTLSPTTPTIPVVEESNDVFVINDIVIKDVNINNGFDITVSLSSGFFDVDIRMPTFAFLIFSPLSNDVVQISIDEAFVINTADDNPPINSTISVLDWQNLILLANEIAVNESVYLKHAYIGSVTESTKSVLPPNGLNFLTRMVPKVEIDLSTFFNSTREAIENENREEGEADDDITHVTEFDIDAEITSTQTEAFLIANLTVLYDQNFLNKITLLRDFTFEMYVNGDNGFATLDIQSISFRNDVNIPFIEFVKLKIFGDANETVSDIFNGNDLDIKITSHNDFVIDMVIPATLIKTIALSTDENSKVATTNFLEVQSIHILGGNNPGEDIILPCLFYGYCGVDDSRDDNLDFSSTLTPDVYTLMNGVTIGILADILTSNNDDQVGVDLFNFKILINCDLFVRFGFFDNYIGAAKLHKGLLLSNDPALQTKLKMMFTFNLYEETLGETRNLVYLIMNSADAVVLVSGNEDENGQSNFMSNAIISIKQDIDFVGGFIQNITYDTINEDEDSTAASLYSLVDLDLQETTKTALIMGVGIPLNYTGFDVIIGEFYLLLNYTDIDINIAWVEWVGDGLLKLQASDDEQYFEFLSSLFYVDGNEDQRYGVEQLLGAVTWSWEMPLKLKAKITPSKEFFDLNAVDVLDYDNSFEMYFNITFPASKTESGFIDGFGVDIGGSLSESLSSGLDIKILATKLVKNTLPFPVLISYFEYEIYMADTDGTRTGDCGLTQDTGLLNGFDYLNPCSDLVSFIFPSFCAAPILPYGSKKDVTEGGPIIAAGDKDLAVATVIQTEESSIDDPDYIEIMNTGDVGAVKLSIDPSTEMAGRMWDNFYNTRQICGDIINGLVHLSLRADIENCQDTSTTPNADLECTMLLRVPVEYINYPLVEGTTCGSDTDVTNLDGFSGLVQHPDFPNTIPTSSFALIENSGSGARWETADRLHINDMFSISFDVTFSGSGEGEAFGIVFTNVEPTSNTEPKPDAEQGSYACEGLPYDNIAIVFTYQGCNVFAAIKNHDTKYEDLIANSESLGGDEVGKSGRTQTYTLTYSAHAKMMLVQMDQSSGDDLQRILDFDIDLSKELGDIDYAWFGFTGNWAGSDQTQVNINNYNVQIDSTDSNSLTLAPDYFLPIANVDEEGELILVAKDPEGRIRGYGDNTMDIKFYLVNDVNVEIVPSSLTINSISETGYYKANYVLGTRGRYVVKASCISSNCINQNTYTVISTRLFVND